MTTQANINVGQSVAFNCKDNNMTGTGVVLEIEEDWLLIGAYVRQEGYCTFLINKSEVIYN